jgi:hypothetical protein
VEVAGDLDSSETRALLKCIGLRSTFDYVRQGFRRDNDRRSLKRMTERPVPLMCRPLIISPERTGSSLLTFDLKSGRTTR